MNLRLHPNYLYLGLVILFLLPASTHASEPAKDRTMSTMASNNSLFLSWDSDRSITPDKAAYNCILRVFIVEPLSSRYYNDQNPPGYYTHGFLDFAVNEELHILDEYSGSVIWDGDDKSFSDLEESNIMVIAALYNLDKAYDANSSLLGDRPFTAYFVDATVAANPGNPGSNSGSGSYTHTVLVEEVTATDCIPCAKAREVLDLLNFWGTRDFLHVALVVDQNPVAYDYIYYSDNAYNPTLLSIDVIDGGNIVAIIESTQLSNMQFILDVAGAQAVVDINVNLEVTWLGDNEIQVDYTIANPNYANSAPNDPDTPIGDALGSTGESYDFSASAYDPDYYHQVYFKWDFGNGEFSDWLGPYNNNEPCNVTYTWASSGLYDIRVQAKDELDIESGWSDPYPVEIYLCSDLDKNGIYDILDIIMLIDHKFKGGLGPSPWQAADTDNNGIVDILDIIVMIDNKFKEGDPPNCPK
jgi:hypothetical protein